MRPVYPFIFLLSTLFTSFTFAHNIWVEAPTHLIQGTPTPVTAYFAHPDQALGDRDQTSLSLNMITPLGQHTILALTEHATYYTATLAPQTPGLYQLLLSREPYRYRLSEIRDFGKTWLGNESLPEASVPPAGLALEIHPTDIQWHKNGHSTWRLQALHQGQPVPDIEISVYQSEDESELRLPAETLNTDNQGEALISLAPAKAHLFTWEYRVPARAVENTGWGVREVRYRTTLFVQLP